MFVESPRDLVQEFIQMNTFHRNAQHAHGAFRCSGDLPNAGLSSNGSATSLCRLVASAHHSSCEKHLPQYFCHRSGSLLSFEVSIFPSRSNKFCAMGMWIMAETGRHPSSPRVVRRATPARVPPH
mmetsp:Transcript_13115/g.31898  ORF Transcript_13115/g.31898 Transcript_13115/m.31898 type:complete len:125 (+) Transcript_13115:268-642(+)